MPAPYLRIETEHSRRLRHRLEWFIALTIAALVALGLHACAGYGMPPDGAPVYVYAPVVDGQPPTCPAGYANPEVMGATYRCSYQEDAQ